MVLGHQPAHGHAVEPVGFRDASHARRIIVRFRRGGGGPHGPCAIGTDTGGSVRMPASWCGITGLKTTIGRISTHGVLPLSHTLDTPGPMARSVQDCAILLELLQGADRGTRKHFYSRPARPCPPCAGA